MILEAALRVAALSGWRRLTFSAVAEEAGVSLASVLRHYPARAKLITTWMRLVDNAMLTDDIVLDPRETIRDRLFDLLMRRFDALAPNKEALRALVPSFGRDLSLAGAFGRSLMRSMNVTLEAAGVDVVGARGLLRIKALEAAYLHVMRIWLKDDTPDMATTMAALDKTLDRLDSMARGMPSKGFGPCSRENACDTATGGAGL